MLGLSYFLKLFIGYNFSRIVPRRAEMDQLFLSNALLADRDEVTCMSLKSLWRFNQSVPKKILPVVFFVF